MLRICTFELTLLFVGFERSASPLQHEFDMHGPLGASLIPQNEVACSLFVEVLTQKSLHVVTTVRAGLL